MTESETISVTPEYLHQKVTSKLKEAGLLADHAEEVANHLVFADANGIHSHGVVRLEYYAEQISKGGVTLHPSITFEETGPSTGILHGDNGVGQYVALEALEYGIKKTKESGMAAIGISKMSHCGTMSYYVKKAAEQDLIAIAMCQSDPMVVPFGGKSNYFGTNPIAFAAPRMDHPPVVFDMATTVQAWGKILDARSKNKEIPSTWAVDKEGNPTTNPHNVYGLLPIAGPKGYGLMMMVDILSGMLLGLPFGKHVSSMYADLEAGRDLGGMFLFIDPKRFTDLTAFKENVNQMVEELHRIEPAEGFKQVYYPGEIGQLTYEKNLANGIPIAKSIYEYLESERLHSNQYGKKNTFAD